MSVLGHGPARRWLNLAVEIALPVLVLALWWFGSAHSEEIFFPPLARILRSFHDTWLAASATSDLLPSLRRLAIGYAIAVALGIGLGTLLGLWRVARRAADPIVEFLRAIPPPALLPFGILVFGIGDFMKVLMIATVCLWPVLLNTIDGVGGIDPTLRDTTRVYGIPLTSRLVFVTLPAAAPQIFAGARTGLSLSIIMMVISEMVASTNGVGYQILQSQQTFRIADMWAGILMLGVLGYLLNALFLLVEHRVIAWHRAAHTGEHR
ncbi:MAG: ABC transporter permease [Candidatus Dormibacteraeota bacterium]|nr:ABC transporter permease [Candidatus Dormibacteraeota bacterium]